MCKYGMAGELCGEFTSLYDIETPGNFVELTTETPVGAGGNDAADAAPINAGAAQRAGLKNTIIKKKVYQVQGECRS
jgi:predicted proteasome-type protease